MIKTEHNKYFDIKTPNRTNDKERNFYVSIPDVVVTSGNAHQS